MNVTRCCSALVRPASRGFQTLLQCQDKNLLSSRENQGEPPMKSSDTTDKSKGVEYKWKSYNTNIIQYK